MFVRKKKNKSGSWSVMLVTGERIAGKKHPVPRIIKNFGFTTNEKELSNLLDAAEQFKKQLQLVSPKAKTLKISSSLEVKSCSSYNTGFSDVYGDMFNKVFGKLQIKPRLLEQLQKLSILRIAKPVSKRKTVQIAEQYGFSCELDKIYKDMDLISNDVINNIKHIVHTHTAQLLKTYQQTVDVLFYDLTTIYFETSSADELRDFGFSKDGKHQHVQIVLAIIVTKSGLPIDYEEFPGNTYEGHTLLPVIKRIQAKYKIDNAILVADAALMNKINLADLTINNIKYVIAARIKNTTNKVKQDILNTEDYMFLKQTVDYDGILTDELKAKILPLTTDDDFLIIYHSAKRARKDAYDREKDLLKIQQYLNSTAKSKLTSRLKKPYVKISKSCKIEIDHIKLAEEQKFDGFFGIRTNIKNPDPKELLASYRGLWQVEQTFRVTKHNLSIRPVFHYNPKRIRAHFAICYISLSLVRYVEFILKQEQTYFPCEQFHLMLDKMNKIKIVTANDELFEFLEDPPTTLVEPYRALGLKWHQKFQHVTGL